jgi:hypothetical protein
MGNSAENAEKLRERLQRIQAISENVPGLVFHFDSGTLDVNCTCAAFEDVFGLGFQQIERDVSVLLNLVDEKDRGEIRRRGRECSRKPTAAEF